MKNTVWIPFPITEQIHISSMYSLFIEHFEKGYEFPGETHNFWECLYVLEGQVCVSADERVYNMSRGEIIFHKPLELHKFKVTQSQGATLLIFSFSAEGLLTTQFRDKVFCLTQSQNARISEFILYIKETVTSPELFNSHHDYLGPVTQIPTYGQMIVSYLYQLFLSLVDEGIIASASSAPDAVIFGNAIGYLNSNLHRQPTVLEIAKFCTVSEASLKRIFDKYAGISIHKYLLKLKIKAATEFLQDGESVCNVAERLGFSSQSYFSKAYKRETGISPSNIEPK
ncbi:MAG: helix-turn-helix transcriptional regulator [Lachnospiraceae bacterium]|nr:helix-turn-helix transcriptional regulator [Lachnospiraceae bacterium]